MYALLEVVVVTGTGFGAEYLGPYAAATSTVAYSSKNANNSQPQFKYLIGRNFRGKFTKGTGSNLYPVKPEQVARDIEMAFF